MKATALFFISVSSLFAPLANADTASITQCIDQKYRTLTDRRGIVAAVVDAQNTKILTYGTAQKDQIFEIGSITKTFTGTLLAQDVNAGRIKLSDPIPSEFQKSETPITYQHLTTHTSGIIGGTFANYKSPNPESPYDSLGIPLFKELYHQTALAYPTGQQWVYSNIATGLLGLLLAEKNQTTYNDLVTDQIFKPLGMKDSYFEVPADQLYRFPQGNVNGETFSHWDLYNTAISAAGSIRSTISDMALYARANLIPASTTLASAIETSHQPLYQRAVDSYMGMNWIIEPKKQIIWHNGSTVGFKTILVISQKHQAAVVAMTDTGIFKMDSNGKAVMDESLQDAVFECLK